MYMEYIVSCLKLMKSFLSSHTYLLVLSSLDFHTLMYFLCIYSSHLGRFFLSNQLSLYYLFPKLFFIKKYSSLLQKRVASYVLLVHCCVWPLSELFLRSL